MTRTDVARHAGVSSAVVSYVVNDGPRNVAPATRERVLESIRVLDYRPNHAARALKLGTSQLIGLVIPDTTNVFFAQFASAVELAADKKGLSVIVVNSALLSGHGTPLLERLVTRQVDGIIFAASDDGADISGVVAAGIPVVVLNPAESVGGPPSLGVDFFDASRRAVEHLINHGHRSIGLIAGAPRVSTAEDREAGWRAALASAGLTPGPLVLANFTRDGGYAAGKELLSAPDRPTAVFVISDNQAIGFLRAMHESGVAVPGEMAVISFDGSIESEFCWPPLTSMHQPITAMAEAAIQSLTRQHGADEDHREFETDLVARQSCGCVAVIGD